MDKLTRLHIGNPKTSVPSFKNFEDILSKSGVFDQFKPAKIFSVVSSVALHTSKLSQFFSVFM